MTVSILTFITCLILGATIYTHSKFKSARQRRKRTDTVPIMESELRQGIDYHVQLSDGRQYDAVQIVGTTDTADGQFSFGGYEGALILLRKNGKRIYVRLASVRCIEEI